MNTLESHIESHLKLELNSNFKLINLLLWIIIVSNMFNNKYELKITWFNVILSFKNIYVILLWILFWILWYFILIPKRISLNSSTTPLLLCLLQISFCLYTLPAASSPPSLLLPPHPHPPSLPSSSSLPPHPSIFR